jgi:tetratricopeptide (TPR) repeat protein
VSVGNYGLTTVAGSPRAGSWKQVAWPVRSGLVPPLAEGFVARTETVPGLEAALAPGSVVALVGEAAEDVRDRPLGCGKTQLAAYLAGSLWRSRGVDLLAWVDATSRASVLSGYGQAAAKLSLGNAGDAEAVATRFLAWLEGTSRPWLVVLDDLRDVADLDGLYPAGPSGRVLVTTADAATVTGEPGVRVATVPAFSMREALNYLAGRLTTDTDQRNGAMDLAGELGCEPAALAQAAAVIISSGIRCCEYRDYLIQRRAQPATGEPATVGWLAWTGSASHAEQLAPGAGIWQLLVLIALVDGYGVPGTVFTGPATCRYLAGENTGRAPDPGRSWSALLALERAGLVNIDTAATPPAVWVSPGVQAAVRAAAPPGLVDRAARAAADALAEVWLDGQPRSQLAATLRSCAARVWQAAGDALWMGGCPWLLLAAGRSLDGAGLAGPAVAWWREVTADSQRILGPGHPDTLVVAGLLAGALLAAGQAAEAVAWFRWVLAGCTHVLGPEHPATLAAPVSLGRALAAAGEPGGAMRVLEQAARHAERVRGPGDAVTLAAWDEYVGACVAAGNAGEAIGCGQRTLAARERLCGPDHPAALTARLRLAEVCLAGGKAGDAIAECQRVLAGRERVLGADHPETLAARARLAAAYDAAGQMSASLQQHQEACAGYERVFGADHPDTLARRADLARACYAAGQAGEAVMLLRDAIARSEKTLSPGDPLTITLRQALAGITGEMTAGDWPGGHQKERNDLD